ncbi:hypothetical protein AKJ50_01945 [candidate division MSBL1 archaeon SCGC-AAA382A13]|uniref:Uncharacterized protein n=1 Tax=candidate division MSBL1 archaeon SCGC-AAA382A13 TaxID=1698279 RepID=A0A133VEI6_9EURY|nr:hypothetical protein AKJ50_01945 [candidate division MSBL1 archaeon SCGC-AAA382A13]
MSEKKELEEIRESAEEIVESFAEIVKDLPIQEETYYEQEALNVLREDEKPASEKSLKEFRENFLKIMPSHDEEGNLKVEVAEWTK